MKKIDFFARWPHFADHLAPIAHALGEVVGAFYCSPHIEKHINKQALRATPLPPRTAGNPLEVYPLTENPLVVAATGDLALAHRANRKGRFVLMEHGVGLVFPNNQSYAGGKGIRRMAELTLAPNSRVRDLTAKAIPGMKQAIIGTPKLDRWAYMFDNPIPLQENPVVCISFHWDGSRVAPEAGTAFPHFQNHIQELARRTDFRLVAHGHPRSIEYVRPFYEKLGIPFWDNFERVMNEADLYINDCSSTMYEFLVTGKPVILLNSPKFRRDVSFGIRFWDYTDIGFQVDHPEKLLPAIHGALNDRETHRGARQKAVQDLYPYLGWSAQVAAKVILEHFK